MTDPQTNPGVDENFDPDADRYPTLSEVISAILDRIDSPGLVVERVEITALASGEATYRVWEPKADEPDGGYLEAGFSR